MKRNVLERVDFSKFGVPSWRIEQKYAPGVLIGNWSEDRYKFPETKYKHNSTYRIDFQNSGGSHPDVNIRRKAKLADEGMPADMLFRHHGSAYNNMHITLYDENYNGRWREKNLPPLRNWDSQTLKWLPERSDYPLLGESTNWGLKEQIKAKQIAKQKQIYRPEFESTYMGSYQNKQADATMQFPRFAISKHLSTTLLTSNNVNSDLHLRGKPNFRVPEVLPDELTRVSV